MNRARRVAYSAVSAAIGIVCVLAASFLPTYVPYLVAGVAGYVALTRCGFWYGLASYLVVSCVAMLVYFAGALPFVLLFGAHPIVVFFCNKLKGRRGYGAVYYGAMVTFFNVAFFALYRLAGELLFSADVIRDFFGGYIMLAVVGTVVFLVYDYAVLLAVKELVRRSGGCKM